MKKDHTDTFLAVLVMISVVVALIRFLEVHAELVDTAKELQTCQFYQEYAINSMLNN